MTASAGTPLRAIACTGNPHKVEELRDLLPLLALEPMPDGVRLPPEVGATFVDNARIKAVGGHAALPDAWVLADDSGLCVDALDGDPGVRSARFAGVGASDRANVELLLRRLAGVAEHRRTARFECVLVAVSPDGDELVASGSVGGTIAAAPRGEQGFGYDPVFVPDGERCTFAELGSDAKAGMSHRARAAERLGQLLAARLADG